MIKVFGVIQATHVYSGKKRIPQGVSQLMYNYDSSTVTLRISFLHLLLRNPPLTYLVAFFINLTKV